MTRQFLVVLILMLLPAAWLARAQAPAAPPQAPPAAAPRPAAQAAAPAATGAAKVAVVDFQRAITENSEGKKAQESFLAEITKRQSDFDKKQKSLDDAQTKLRTQEKVLDDTAKPTLTKQVDQPTTDLNPMHEAARR